MRTRRGAGVRGLCAAAVVALMLTAGCTSRPTPVLDSREALGTVVSVTAYGAPDDAVHGALDEAYAAMSGVEAALDAHDPASPLARFNADPYREHALPDEAVTILDAIDDLGVVGSFSPGLWSVVGLYAFENSHTVPPEGDLRIAVAAGHTLVRPDTGTAAFTRLAEPDPRLEPGGALAPGLDLGGAAKGLALQYAREVLRESTSVEAALVTAGSTTVTLGGKPDAEPWRIGIEDPREPGTIVATVEANGEVAVSTSGDYQRYFEVDGERYHHILDPATGRPARGLRSLTVIGAHSGLDSDILSTALFVIGAERAIAYAEEHGLGLFLVDDEGRTQIVPGPEDRSWDIVAAE